MASSISDVSNVLRGKHSMIELRESLGSAVMECREAQYDEGAVGVAMTGNVTLDTILSPACRPIGRPFVMGARFRW